MVRQSACLSGKKHLQVFRTEKLIEESFYSAERREKPEELGRQQREGAASQGWREMGGQVWAPLHKSEALEWGLRQAGTPPGVGAKEGALNNPGLRPQQRGNPESPFTPHSESPTGPPPGQHGRKPLVRRA